mgnify:CR=1 FL=1
MWLKRLTNSFLGIRNKEELENDLDEKTKEILEMQKE